MSGKLIIVYDLVRESMDAYKDLTPISEMVNIPRTTLQGRLSKRIQIIDSKIIGYAAMHKSGRGGVRIKKEDHGQ